MPKKKETTKIKINDKYFVEIDDYNYILNKYTEVTNKKTGEVSVKPLVQGYYPSLNLALEHLKRMEISDIQSELSLDNYLDELKKLENWVTTLKIK